MPIKDNLTGGLLKNTRNEVKMCFDGEIAKIEDFDSKSKMQQIKEAASAPQVQQGLDKSALRAIAVPFDQCALSLLAQQLREIANDVDEKIAALAVDHLGSKAK